MSEDCLFCRIVAGDIPSRTVYEDGTVVAFLDVNPLARGHTLVVPKEHHPRLQDVPEEAVSALWAAVHRLVPAVEEGVDADATNVGLNNGPASGQEIPHLHVHIVPRFDGDGGNPIHAVGGRRPSLSEEEFDEVEASIAETV